MLAFIVNELKKIGYEHYRMVLNNRYCHVWQHLLFFWMMVG